MQSKLIKYSQEIAKQQPQSLTCCFAIASSRCWSSVWFWRLVSSSSNSAFCKFIRSWTFSLISWLKTFNQDSSSSAAFSFGLTLNCDSFSSSSFFNRQTSIYTTIMTLHQIELQPIITSMKIHQNIYLKTVNHSLVIWYMCIDCANIFLKKNKR